MSAQRPTFGHGMRPLFSFDDKWVNLNHGSFGAWPRVVQNARNQYAAMNENAPDKFMRYDYVALLDRSREQLASILHAPVDECVILQNATLALNTILRNLIFKEKDVVVYFDFIYGSIEKTLLSIRETQPSLHLWKVGEVVQRKLKLPMSHMEICDAFLQTIYHIRSQGYNVRAAVYDTISSLPAVRLPFEELTKICKANGILSIIDGAHSIGQIPLDLEELDADFFTSNCHKWLYTPRACAVLHVPKRNQPLIRTSFPTSWGFIPSTETKIRQVLPAGNPSQFVNLFQFVATADNTPFYCIPAALDFRQSVCGGDHAIYEYITNIAQKGADTVAALLGTEVLGECEDELSVTKFSNAECNEHKATDGSSLGLRDCAMSNVLLPINVGDIDEALGPDRVQQIVEWIQNKLIADHHTFVPVFAYQDKIWTRLSGQIYLEVQDFEWLGKLLQNLCQRVRTGEPFSSR